MTAIYDTIGLTYDVTRQADPEIAKHLIKLLKPAQHKKYLDIGCGSGNYTNAIASAGFNIHGIDISSEMLIKAKNKFPSLNFLQGYARNLPFEDDQYDGATCVLATHHIGDFKKAFQEAYRVIQSGFFVIFTATPEQMKNYWLSHYFPTMIKNSAEKMAYFHIVENALIDAGFSNIKNLSFFITNQLQDLFLNSGKYRPEIYLDPRVRDGISSFHLFSNADELKKGLQQLEEDIHSAENNKIIQQYESELGDYLFVVGEKI